MPQALDAQVLVALGRAGHAAPQPPQCATVLVVLVSQPLPALPSQLPKPVLHAKPQVPDAQVADALPGAAQTLLQRPQCEVEVSVRTSQPSLGAALQSPKPPWPHEATIARSRRRRRRWGDCCTRCRRCRSCCGRWRGWSTRRCKRPGPWGSSRCRLPAAHTCPLRHARLHAPQLARSVSRSRHTPEQLQSAGRAAHHAHARPYTPGPAEAQARPHMPQLERSVASVTQTPPHCSHLPRGARGHAGPGAAAPLPARAHVPAHAAVVARRCGGPGTRPCTP